MDVTWMQEATCRDADVKLFFTGEGGSKSYQQGRALCGVCPVSQQCLQYAYDIKADYGMYGGFTDKERACLLARERLAAKSGEGHGDKAGTAAGCEREKRAGLKPCDACREAYNKAARERKARAKKGTSNVDAASN